jgi:16S rRNA C1402 N4-methylase RsmH
MQLDQKIIAHQSLKDNIIGNIRQQVDSNANDQANIAILQNAKSKNILTEDILKPTKEPIDDNN